MLTAYITQVRRLLKDTSDDYWDDDELTDYINEARNKVCEDTNCLRTLVSYTVTAGQESYLLANVSSSAIDVLNVNLINGGIRYRLDYFAWSEFTKNVRPLVNTTGIPSCYSKYGQGVVYLGLIPDQNYLSEWDCVMLPNALVDDTTIEQIAKPFQEPVKYYAAHLAKYQLQAFGEADAFYQRYDVSVKSVIRATAQRRLFSQIFRY